MRRHPRQLLSGWRCLGKARQAAHPRLRARSLWSVQGPLQLKTGAGEPEALLLGRAVREALREAAFTFQVTSEPRAAGNEEVGGLPLVLVNMKKTSKD